MKYSHLQYSLFLDDSCYDSDDIDDDDKICFICDIVWTSDKREWSNIKNVKQDCSNFVNKYIMDKGMK